MVQGSNFACLGLAAVSAGTGLFASNAAGGLSGQSPFAPSVAQSGDSFFLGSIAVDALVLHHTRLGAGSRSLDSAFLSPNVIGAGNNNITSEGGTINEVYVVVADEVNNSADRILAGLNIFLDLQGHGNQSDIAGQRVVLDKVTVLIDGSFGSKDDLTALLVDLSIPFPIFAANSLHGNQLQSSLIKLNNKFANSNAGVVNDLNVHHNFSTSGSFSILDQKGDIFSGKGSSGEHSDHRNDSQETNNLLHKYILLFN